MEERKLLLSIALVLLGVTAILFLKWLLFPKKKGKRKNSKDISSQKEYGSLSGMEPSLGRSLKKKGRHESLKKTLRPHKRSVDGISISKNYLATCCSDEQFICIYLLDDLESENTKFLRISTGFNFPMNVHLRTETEMSGSVVALYRGGSLEIFAWKFMDKVMDSRTDSVAKIPKLHTDQIVSLQLHESRNLLLSGTREAEFKISTFAGETLKTIRTNTIYNNKIEFSPFGDYIAVAGFISEVKIWKMNFTSGGNLASIDKQAAISVQGKSVLDISHCKKIPQFPEESPLNLAILTENGSIKMYDINLLNRKRQTDPKLHFTYEAPVEKMALNSDSTMLAVAKGNTFWLLDIENAQMQDGIALDHEISGLQWWDSKLLFTSSDRNVNAWYVTSFPQ